MGFDIRFSFFGEEQVARGLEGFAARARDMRPAWKQIRSRFVDYETSWFDSEGDGHWPALSKDYAEWKARHFPGRKMLVRSGDMRESVLKPDIDVTEPSYAVFGTADPVAGYHQKGAGRLPVRRVIDIDEQERREWVRVVQRYLLEEEQ